MKIIYYVLIVLSGTVVGVFLNAGIEYVLDEKSKKKFIAYFGIRQNDKRKKVYYSLITLCNGLLWGMVYLTFDFSIQGMIDCCFLSALLMLSMIDFKIYEIPDGINFFIAGLGILNIVVNYKNWFIYVIGFFVVGFFLYLLYQLTNGGAIGGGDVKLMAFSGLILGWKLVLLSFFLGCIAGSIIHVIRMKVSKQGHMLAMGPYLAIGIFLSLLWGNHMISWYIAQCLA